MFRREEDRVIEQSLKQFKTKMQASEINMHNYMEQKIQPVQNHLSKIKETLDHYHSMKQPEVFDISAVKRIEKARKNRKKEMNKRSENAKHFVDLAVNTSQYASLLL